jgi:8-oxo-(d)GTP phosphatase
VSGEVVRAAGCVVWRPCPDGEIEVLVVHRPRYDDWSLPKGKVDPGESDLACAQREVHEETGTTGEIGRELAPTRYLDHQGRPKVVRYWALRATGGRFEPNDEVDQVRWLGIDDAAGLMSYDHDRHVVRSLPRAVGAG